jgi:hypothetical protein
MKLIAVIALAGALVSPCFGQKDFLTSNEVEQVREAQEPNARLKLYVLFARQRLDQLQKLMEKDKKGRSLGVRDLLNEYAGIVDAMDAVSDDALKRSVDIGLGKVAVRDAERKFLTQLEKIQTSGPSDLDQYSIELKEAIESTNDSLELVLGNSEKRAAELTAEEEKAKKERDELVAAEDALRKKPGDADDPAAAKTADAKAQDATPGRKPPTLLRPGEKVGTPSTTK